MSIGHVNLNEIPKVSTQGEVMEKCCVIDGKCSKRVVRMYSTSTVERIYAIVFKNDGIGDLFYRGHLNDHYSASGIGSLQYKNIIYRGEFKDGKINGRGTLIIVDSNNVKTLVGIFKDGKFEKGYCFSQEDGKTKGYQKPSVDSDQVSFKPETNTLKHIPQRVEFDVHGEFVVPNFYESGWDSRKILWWRGNCIFGDEKFERGPEAKQRIFLKESYNYYIGPLKDGRAHGFGIYLTGPFTYAGNFSEGQTCDEGIYADDDRTLIINSRSDSIADRSFRFQFVYCISLKRVSSSETYCASRSETETGPPSRDLPKEKPVALENAREEYPRDGGDVERAGGGATRQTVRLGESEISFSIGDEEVWRKLLKATIIQGQLNSATLTLSNGSIYTARFEKRVLVEGSKLSDCGATIDFTMLDDLERDAVEQHMLSCIEASSSGESRVPTPARRAAPSRASPLAAIKPSMLDKIKLTKTKKRTPTTSPGRREAPVPTRRAASSSEESREPPPARRAAPSRASPLAAISPLMLDKIKLTKTKKRTPTTSPGRRAAPAPTRRAASSSGESRVPTPARRGASGAQLVLDLDTLKQARNGLNKT